MKRFGQGIDVGVPTKKTEINKQKKSLEKLDKSDLLLKPVLKNEIINFVLPPITKKTFKIKAKEEFGSFGKSKWINAAIDELFELENWQSIVLECDSKDCSAREQFTVTPERKNQIKLEGLKLQHFAMEQEMPFQVTGAISIIVRAAIIIKLK
jgi:hypothetical protein